MDNLLKEVQHILEMNLPKEVSNTVNKLAGEYVKLSNKSRSQTSGDIVPDIDALRYQAGLLEGDNSGEGNSIENVRSKLQDYLRDKHSEKFLNITNDKTARMAVEKEIISYCTNNIIRLKGMDQNQTIEFLTKDILDFGILTEPIFSEEEEQSKKIEEIRVNEFDDIRVVIDGVEYETDLRFESPEQLMAIAQKMCRNYKADMVKPDRPFVRLRMGNNIRVSIMINPVARRADEINSTVVQMTIRKQSPKPFTKEFLLDKGTLDEYTHKLISLAINNKISTAFFGGTNSGKTALMTSFSKEMKKTNRAITVAEIDEMNLREIDPVTKKALNSVLMWELSKDMGFRELVNASLTFTPNTLVLQETKSGEIVDIMEASITDHQVLTSLHAMNKKVFGTRCLTMYKQSGSDLTDTLILKQVVQAFPFIVRTKIYEDGKRRVAEVAELVDYDKVTDEFTTRTLVEFQVENTEETTIYNEFLGKEVQTATVTGKFVAREFFSADFMYRLRENGASKKDIEELRAQYDKLIK